MGDVIADRDDIFGAGVNVAARLEQMCEPGGVSISGRVHEDIDGKLDAEFRDLGERKLKKIERTVRVYGCRRARASPLRPPLRSGQNRRSISRQSPYCPSAAFPRNGS